METYTTLHVNQMGDSENSNQGFVTTEGWDGVGGERELQAGGDVCMGLPSWLSAKETACSAEDAGDLVRLLGWDDPLEEGMATHSSILAWRIPGTEEPGGLRSMGSQEVGHD